MSAKLKLCDIAYFSSEHQRNSVKNLITGAGKWTTPTNSKLDILEAEFSLACPSKISGIDVGNYWSSSLEVLVGLSDMPQNKREVLLPEHTFMNRINCSVGENKEKMMFFREEKFNQEVVGRKWDRVKVICRQPFKFNNDVFGLGMFVLHGGKGSLGHGEARKAIEPEIRTKLSSGSGSGLFQFMKRNEKIPKVSHELSPLKSLKNQKSISTAKDSGVSFSFDSSAMSTSGKLVVHEQSRNDEHPTTFQQEAAQFLKECKFEEKAFAEIEAVTFRNVKELWLEKKKSELKKEEREILKSLSSQYLSKVSKRCIKKLKGEEENFPPTKRKVSDNLQNIRKRVPDDDCSTSNKSAAMDIEKSKESSSNAIEDTQYTPSNLSQPVTYKSGSRSSLLGKRKTPDPTFDLSCSPEITPEDSPVKSNRSIDSNLGSLVPNYKRRQLLSIPHASLISSGVLVQVYNYKKDKNLPLKGRADLSVKKGEPLTFFKVGPNIHLEYKNVFYTPDIEPQYLERVFKNFSPQEVNNNTFPSRLNKLLNIGGSNESSEPNDNKFEAFDDLSSPHKSPALSPPQPTAPPEGECPICYKTLPLNQLGEHAADCEVLESDIEEGGDGRRLTACPICQLEVEFDLLESHATSCAANMFGV